MHNNKMEEFLKGNSDFEELQNAKRMDKIDDEFIQSYKKLINESNSEIPDFNPFEKVKENKQKRIWNNRKILLYAASVFIAASIFFASKNYNPKPTEVVLNEQELNEIKHNTQLALAHFSKEFNNCMSQFENAKKMHEPISEMQSLKNYKIEFSNPIKNLKINTP